MKHLLFYIIFFATTLSWAEEYNNSSINEEYDRSPIDPKYRVDKKATIEDSRRKHLERLLQKSKENKVLIKKFKPGIVFKSRANKSTKLGGHESTNINDGSSANEQVIESADQLVKTFMIRFTAFICAIIGLAVLLLQINKRKAKGRER